MNKILKLYYLYLKVSYNNIYILTFLIYYINLQIMTASYLPSILVPLVGIIFPGLSMALLFLYIQEENII